MVVAPAACVGESITPMGLIHVSFITPKLKINLLGFIRDGLLLFPVAYNKTGKRLDEDKHFTKSGHTLSSIRISEIFITDTYTSTPRQSGQVYIVN